MHTYIMWDRQISYMEICTPANYTHMTSYSIHRYLHTVTYTYGILFIHFHHEGQVDMHELLLLALLQLPHMHDLDIISRIDIDVTTYEKTRVYEP